LQTSYGINATPDGWMGDGLVDTARLYDARIVAGSAWSQDQGHVSFGYSTLAASTSTNALAFTPSQAVDTFEIYYVIDTDRGSLSANIDGGSATVRSSTGAAAVGTLVLTTGSVGTHTLNVYWSSGGPVNIIGEISYDSTTRKVITINGGSSGENSTQAANTSKAYGGGNSAIYSAIGCDLTVLEGGPNDWAGGNVSLFTTNSQTIISALLAAGSDIVIDTPNPGNPATETTVVNQQAFNAAMKALAIANSNLGTPGVPLPIIDTYTTWQSYAAANSLGWYADTNIHPNALGHYLIAKNVESAIVESPSQVAQPNPVPGKNYIVVTSGNHTVQLGDGTIYLVGASTSVTLPVVGLIPGTEVHIVNASPTNVGSIINNGQTDNIPATLYPYQGLLLDYIGGNNWWMAGSTVLTPSTISSVDISFTLYTGTPTVGAVSPGINYDASVASLGYASGAMVASPSSGVTYVDNYASSGYTGWRWCVYPAGTPLSNLSQYTACYSLPIPGSNATLATLANLASPGAIGPTSISGTGTATFAAGAGAGTSPGTPTCSGGYICDSYSGVFNITTGTAPPTGGTVVTVTLGGVTRTNKPNCFVSSIASVSGVPFVNIIALNSTVATLPVQLAGTALTASTNYTFTYVCGGK
jgi:lysophospholipase L1-like esterase